MHLSIGTNPNGTRRIAVKDQRGFGELRKRVMKGASPLGCLDTQKPLVIVADSEDPLFPIAATLRAFRELLKIYAACGAADRCQLVMGNGSHRFYAYDAWPVMIREIAKLRR